ncbi:MAG: hypothetical protein WD072_00095 [Pirellulales bacterium]
MMQIHSTFAAIVLALAATTAAGQQLPIPRSGGLVPSATGPKLGLTREELIRGWDLDGNGTISKSEADLARARMRRQRLEMQLGAGLDPLTGLPRGIDVGDVGEEEDEPLFQLPPEISPPQSRRQGDSLLPGTRPPPMTPPAAAAPALTPMPGATFGTGRQAAPAATTPTAVERSGRASWLPQQTRGSSPTGGVRAGAPAAVPGYGSGPWSDLNAGRPRAPAIESGPGTSGRGPLTGGGLLPSGRPPGRTGAIILPGQAPQPGMPRQPPPPPTPTFPSPRITAEEIGGYRP